MSKLSRYDTTGDRRMGTRQRLAARPGWIACPIGISILFGCQTFLEVHQLPFRAPEFTWASGVAVASLVVLADPSCPQLRGTSLQDRVWWQLSGNIKPPVVYGELPPGATLLATARPLDEDCGPWTVTVTDSTLRAESSTFSAKHITPLPMPGP